MLFILTAIRHQKNQIFSSSGILWLSIIIGHRLKKEKKKVSLLIPCYNEKAAIPAHYEALDKLMSENDKYE